MPFSSGIYWYESPSLHCCNALPNWQTLRVNHILCYIFQANLFQVSISSNIVQAIYFLLHLFEQNSCTNIFSATPVSCIFSHQHSFIYFVLQVCQPLFSCYISPVWVLSCHVPLSDWTKRSSCHNWSIWMASLPCEYSHVPLSYFLVTIAALEFSISAVWVFS